MTPILLALAAWLAVSLVLTVAFGAWIRRCEQSTGRRAGADLGDPDPQTGSDSPHGAAPIVVTPCPDCGWPLALDFGRDLVCLRCASVWQREGAR